MWILDSITWSEDFKSLINQGDVRGECHQYPRRTVFFYHYRWINL